MTLGSMTALHFAVSSGSADMVKLLLDAGAAIDATDVRGYTPLDWSVATDDARPEIASLLIARGAGRGSTANWGTRPRLGANTITRACCRHSRCQWQRRRPDLRRCTQMLVAARVRRSSALCLSFTLRQRG